MGRRSKKDRTRRREQARQFRAGRVAAGAVPFSGFDEGDAPADLTAGAGLELHEYEIITEPMLDPREAQLAPADRERVQRLTERVHEAPAKVLEEARQLLAEFPDIPKLHNYTMIAAEAAGLGAEAERMIEDAYRRFPEYVFGVCSYVNLRLSQGRLAEAEQALEGRRMLHQLTGGRRRFHLSEVVSFFSTLALLCDAKGEREHAQRHLEILQRLAPEHPLTRQTESRLAGGMLMGAVKRLFAMRSRRRRGSKR